MKSTMKNDCFFCFFTNAFSKVVPHPSTPDIRHAPKQPHANVSENRFTACTRQQPLPRFFTPLQDNGYNTKSSENTKKHGRKGQTRDLQPLHPLPHGR